MVDALRHLQADASLLYRLWLYQAERFPLLKTGILLAVFSSASISVSAQLAGRDFPSFATFFATWIAVFAIFFQMRACDEWKDLEDDRRYRPKRPIPSGLVSLRMVTGIALGLGVVTIIATAWVSLHLLWLLGAVWLWLALMTLEFFVPKWLKARLWLYLASHMAIMPLIDLFLTGAEWVPHGWNAPPGLWLFLVLSFLNGCVLELGRKIWASENEREGVESYSRLLGPTRAATMWVGVSALSCAVLIAVGIALGAPFAVGVPGVLAFAILVWSAWRYVNAPVPSNQKRVDLVAGLWVFCCYVLAGFAPLLVSA